VSSAKQDVIKRSKEKSQMLRVVGDGLHRAEVLEKQLAAKKQRNSQLQQ
jgi:hypothetical protein